jgi:hypothetical protein
MKKIYAVVAALFALGLVIGVGAAQTQYSAAENVIVNGDYGNGLDNWDFKDTSLYYSSAKADIEDGRARIRLYGLWGRGTLSQNLPASITPKLFKTDYEIKGILHQKIQVVLNPEIVYCVETKVGLPINAYMTYYNERYDYDVCDGTNYKKATLEIQFDHKTGETRVYLDGIHKNTFDLASQGAILSVESVELKMIGHGILKEGSEEELWDEEQLGDEKCLKKAGYFDNVVLHKMDDTQIPEFSTIALPVVLTLAIMVIYQRKRQNKQ